MSPAHRSVYFGAGELDGLGPLLRLGRHEGISVGGTEKHRRRTELGKPRREFWLGKARVDLLIQFRDHLGGCRLRRANPKPGNRLKVRYYVGYRVDIR